jgi:hypothetical protein
MGFSDALAKHTPSGTREFSLGIRINSSDNAVLISKHAGFSNKALTNAQLKQFNARQASRGTGVLSEAQIAADLADDAKLLAQHALTGWRHVCEIEDVPTQATPEKRTEFLLELAQARPDIFRAYRDWASNADNFVDTPLGDPEELGK